MRSVILQMFVSVDGNAAASDGAVDFIAKPTKDIGTVILISRYSQDVDPAGQGRFDTEAAGDQPLARQLKITVDRLRQATIDGTFTAEVTALVKQIVALRRTAILVEQRQVPSQLAALSAEANRLLETMADMTGTARRLADGRVDPSQRSKVRKQIRNDACSEPCIQLGIVGDDRDVIRDVSQPIQNQREHRLTSLNQRQQRLVRAHSPALAASQHRHAERNTHNIVIRHIVIPVMQTICAANGSHRPLAIGRRDAYNH